MCASRHRHFKSGRTLSNVFHEVWPSFTASVAEPTLFWAAPEVRGPGADSAQIGSALGSSRRLRLHTLKFVILTVEKLIINSNFIGHIVVINCSKFMRNKRTRLFFFACLKDGDGATLNIRLRPTKKTASGGSATLDLSVCKSLN